MREKSCILKRIVPTLLLMIFGLTPLYASEILGSKGNPHLVPEGFAPEVSSMPGYEGDVPAFVGPDGEQKLVAESEVKERDRLGQHYRTEDGQLWILQLSEIFFGKEREYFYHFHQKSQE